MDTQPGRRLLPNIGNYNVRFLNIPLVEGPAILWLMRYSEQFITVICLISSAFGNLEWLYFPLQLMEDSCEVSIVTLRVYGILFLISWIIMDLHPKNPVQ